VIAVVLLATAPPHPCVRYLQVGLDSRLKRSRVRTHNLANLLAVLEEHDSRHGADGELLRDVWDFVDVELVEARVGVLVGESVVCCQHMYSCVRDVCERT
jgi:hypothetical protein